jgi:hypothetical protein
LAASQQHYCPTLIDYCAKQHCYKLWQDNCAALIVYCVNARLLRLIVTLLRQTIDYCGNCQLCATLLRKSNIIARLSNIIAFTGSKIDPSPVYGAKICTPSPVYGAKIWGHLPTGNAQSSQ